MSLMRGVTYEKEKFTQKEIDEFANEFVNYVNMLVGYFENTNSCKTTRERLNMLAFCILSAIDGEAGGIGGHLLIPIDGGDEGDHLDPALPENLYDYDIAGALHDRFCDMMK